MTFGFVFNPDFNNEDLVIHKKTKKVGNLVDVLPIFSFGKCVGYQYIMWVRYTSEFMRVNQEDIELFESDNKHKEKRN